MNDVVPITWKIGTLPIGSQATPQEFYEAIFARTKATLDLSMFLLGQIGGTMPTTNVGPWLKNNKEWWIWNTQSLTYEPMDDSLEIGDMIPTASETCDGDKWLFCDGRAISRSAPYDQLFARIGVKHGKGDGSTTFNLPRSASRVPIGVGVGAQDDGTPLSQRIMGEIGGLELVQLKKVNLPAPDTVSVATTGSASKAVQVFKDTTSTDDPNNPNVGVGHDNMMPWFAVLWKIRYR